MPKTFIIGLDGGTWRILRPLLEMGHMPRLKKLVDDGASGVLNSTEPPVTAPAWSSFLTGVLPGKHGIFEFNNYKPGTYSTHFVNGSFLSYKTMWDLLGEAGRKIISINVPMTYPPKSVNGKLVSCMLTPSTEGEFTYPHELRNEIFDLVGEYKIITTGKVFSLHGLHKFVDELIDTEERRVKVAKYLLQQYEWDVAMVHIQSTDVLQHYLYHVLDEQHSLHDGKKDVAKVRAFYESIDRGIGEMLDVIPGDAMVLVMSDHGFRPVNKMINLNAILAERGFLHTHQDKRLFSHVTRLASRLMKYDRLNLNRWLLGRNRRKIFEKVKKTMIDFSRTTAFVINGWVYGNIYLNLEGREESWVVRKEEYDSVRTRIMSELAKIEDPDTGKRLFRVFRREDIFDGTVQEHAADIVVVPDGPYEFTGSIYFRDKEFIFPNRVRREHTGSHEKEGIVVLAGGQIRRRTLEAHIVDIMPTILWYSGLPVPDYVDGKVLTEAFDDGFVAANPVAFKKTDKGPDVHSGIEDESEEIQDRLKSLGYL